MVTLEWPHDGEPCPSHGCPGTARAVFMPKVEDNPPGPGLWRCDASSIPVLFGDPAPTHTGYAWSAGQESEKLTIGSLFSGIGGLELGLERALGAEVLWQVELDEWCRRVLERHWPDADRSVTDVREAGAHNLPPVDIMCGGFPCQNISPAGNGEGLDGEQSGLWSEYERLVGELRPRVVVVENASTLTSRGLGRVLGDLAALGYDAEWTRIGAVDVGAPHRRWRCFIVAWDSNAHGSGRQMAAPGEVQAGGTLPLFAPEPLADADQEGRGGFGLEVPGEQQVQARGVADGRGEDVPDPDPVGRQGQQRSWITAEAAVGGSAQRTSGENAVPAPAVRGMAHGLPTWVGDGPLPRAARGSELGSDGKAALRSLGNSVVPRVAYEVGLWVRAVWREVFVG